MTEPATTTGGVAASLEQAVTRGIGLCRKGRWKEGLAVLQAVDEYKGRPELPGRFYAFLGFGIARYQGKLKNGVALCRRAVELEFYNAENYYWLAQAYSLTRSKRKVLDAVARGLRIDPDDKQLLALRKQFGSRRGPVLPFLARGNPLNKMLGKLRHRLFSPQGAG